MAIEVILEPGVTGRIDVGQPVEGGRRRMRQSQPFLHLQHPPLVKEVRFFYPGLANRRL
ncbi:hypothetical protein [Variovorax sp. CF313]|uniref:hypothetical protein n=1 Tax=Variovorax sp. CF313 TaxID=1144315 RepID=UPI0012F8D40B|nr:hypothetical protein [Variovorax sp. CF313]